MSRRPFVPCKKWAANRVLAAKPRLARHRAATRCGAAAESRFASCAPKTLRSRGTTISPIHLVFYFRRTRYEPGSDTMPFLTSEKIGTRRMCGELKPVVWTYMICNAPRARTVGSKCLKREKITTWHAGLASVNFVFCAKRLCWKAKPVLTLVRAQGNANSTRSSFLWLLKFPVYPSLQCKLFPKNLKNKIKNKKIGCY